MKWTTITKEDIKWIGVDWDDTVVNNSGYPDFTPTTPIDGVVETLNKLNEQGYKIVIYTARSWTDYHNIEKYCEIYGIPARRIICGKPLFNCIVDDKNIEFNGNWNEVKQKILKRNQHP